ncbi:MAG: DUF938 domain-containing protein [Rhodospirillaceae bacterium]
MINTTAGKLFDLAHPSAQRNIQPISEQVGPRLPASGMVVEIAAGSGYHSASFADSYPNLTWQPTDRDIEALGRISEMVEKAQLPNLQAPIALDASSPMWPVDEAAAVLCCNMIHIAPWSAAEGLFAGVGRILNPDGVLFLYGPFKVDGAHTAPSNASFDESLRDRDPSWGIRDTAAVDALALSAGLTLDTQINMPANNMLRIYRAA